MDKEELVNIKGGAGLSSSMLNVFVRLVNSSLELGRTLGTIIRRKMKKDYC